MPSAMTFRITSFGTTERYTGVFIEIDAPDAFSVPWHATQFVLKRSAKSLFASGGFHLSSSRGFPGNRPQPQSAARLTKRRHQFKIRCCIRLLGCLFLLTLLHRMYAQSLGYWPALHRFHFLGLEYHVTADNSECHLADHDTW